MKTLQGCNKPNNRVGSEFSNCCLHFEELFTFCAEQLFSGRQATISNANTSITSPFSIEF